MYNYPCKDCKDRKVGCHATCETYLAARADHVGSVQRYMESRKGDIEAWEMRKAAILKTKRRIRDRKSRK